jgi:hypothetical protein
MKKKICVLVIFAFFVICAACNSGKEVIAEPEATIQIKEKENMTIKVSPDNLTVFELVTTEYDDEQLLKMSEFRGSIIELNNNYPIECLRHIEKGTLYRASYVGDSKVLTFWFNDDGEIQMIKTSLLSPPKAQFDELAIGQSFDDVYQLDPTAEYDFLNTGRTDSPKISSHYSSDGWLIHISYDDQLQITRIISELI